MTKYRLFLILISALTGAVTALGITAFVFNPYNPSPLLEVDKKLESRMTSATPFYHADPLAPQISASDIYKLTLETRSETFCREDLDYQQISTKFRLENLSVAKCESLEISFTPDKSAVKIVNLTYYGEKNRKKIFKKRSVFKAKLTSEQYLNLANTIAKDEIFRQWDDRVDVDQSDSIFSVKYNLGEKRILSNIEDPARSFILMIKPLKEINRQLKWVQTGKLSL